MQRRLRVALAGAVVVGLYLAAAAVSFRAGLVPVRPLYEGTAPPPPYRWVNPPAEVAATNQQPAGGSGTMRLTPAGSEASTIATDDGQAIVAFQQGSVRARKGETAVKLDIEPLDATRVGPPPAGLRYDSNAYRVSATYQPSGTPAKTAATSCGPTEDPKVCPTIVLRYARHATALHRRDGPAWTQIAATSAQASLQIFGDTPSLGIFVVVGPQGSLGSAGGSVGTYLGIGLGVAAVAAAAVASRLRVVKRWRRRLRKRRGGAKRAQKGSPTGKGR